MIAIVGVLIALLLVAVQSAREAARRTQCFNNLHQIGVALHSYHAVHRCFPPGGIEPRSWRRPQGRQYAWSAFLLPYLESESVATKIDFTKAFDDPENAEIAAAVLPTYLCPSTPRSSPLSGGRGAIDYGGIYGERITGRNDPPNGVMRYDTVTRARDILDGTTTTLCIAEDSGFRDGQWINGRNVFDQAFPINRAPAFENDIRSLHPGGANGLFADGSVRFLDENMDLQVLAAICTRAGNEVVPKF